MQTAVTVKALVHCMMCSRKCSMLLQQVLIGDGPLQLWAIPDFCSLPLKTFSTHILDYTRSNSFSMSVNGSFSDYDYVQPWTSGSRLGQWTHLFHTKKTSMLQTEEYVPIEMTYWDLWKTTYCMQMWINGINTSFKHKTCKCGCTTDLEELTCILEVQLFCIQSFGTDKYHTLLECL